MSYRPALVLALAALLAFPACSSEPSQPVRVTNYGQAQPLPGTPQPPPNYEPYSSGSPDGGNSGYSYPTGPAVAGAVNWHYTLADAQAEARASGKLLLVMSTKPRCSMCDKFKKNIAPAVAGELNRMAVGYIYDITRPEVRQVDQALRANLKGADLMPLVGFLTPDLRWVHGFWGARSVNEFRGDIQTARRIHPVRSARIQTPNRVGGPTLAAAVVNEFGEAEWSPASDVWPDEDVQPIDAITGAPDVLAARAAAERAAAARGTEPLVADANPADLPAPPAAPADEPTLGETYQRLIADGTIPGPNPNRPAPPAELPAPPAPAASAPASEPASAAAPTASTPWSAPADQGAGAAAPASPEAVQPKADNLETWGRDALKRALAQIQEGQFRTAKETLDQVHQRLPGTTIAREASKGGVALYNAKRIRLATNGTERSRYLSRARRDFRSSMWGVLFNG